jgi:hypothetical protein
MLGNIPGFVVQSTDSWAVAFKSFAEFAPAGALNEMKIAVGDAQIDSVMLRGGRNLLMSGRTIAKDLGLAALMQEGLTIVRYGPQVFTTGFYEQLYGNPRYDWSQYATLQFHWLGEKRKK